MRNATSLNTGRSNATGSADALLRVRRERHARLAELAEPLGAEPAERDQTAEREQRLVGGHVRGGLLATDVLLAGLEREHEPALALEVGRLADDPPGHAPDELLARRHEAVVRAAVALVVPDGLPLADRHPAAVDAGRLEDAERGEIDVRDRDRATARSRPRRGRAPARGSRTRSGAGRAPRRRRRPPPRSAPGRSCRRRAAPRRPPSRSPAHRSSRPGGPSG